MKLKHVFSISMLFLLVMTGINGISRVNAQLSCNCCFDVSFYPAESEQWDYFLLSPDDPFNIWCCSPGIYLVKVWIWEGSNCQGLVTGYEDYATYPSYIPCCTVF